MIHLTQVYHDSLEHKYELTLFCRYHEFNLYDWLYTLKCSTTDWRLPFLLYTTTSLLLTVGILEGQFMFSSSPTETHLIIIKNILHVHIYHKSGPAVTRWEPAESTLHEAANNNSSLAPPDPSLDVRGVQRPGTGITLEQHKTTGEPPRSDFCSSVGFSDRAGLPCPCHLSCYRTSVKRQRRCPCAGRGWFTNISGEYNYTASPGRAALCGFRMERERGGLGGGVERVGGRSGHWK